MRFRNYLLIAIFFFNYLRTVAQPGTVDPTFNTADAGKNRIVRLIGDKVSAIIEKTKSNEINIYPNPTTGQIHLSLSAPADISVIDMLGKTICKGKHNGGNELIDLSKEKSGIYFLNVDSGNKHQSAKIIIE